MVIAHERPGSPAGVRSLAALARPIGFRGDVEGLRAVAVVLVLLDHAALPLTGGFVGVDVFFVISGYLITSLLLSEFVATRGVSLRDFYARRARRILPAAVAVLVVTGVLTLAFLPRTRWLDIGYDMLASALYVENWRLAGLAVDYQAQDVAASPLQHFWSLAVEEQFYLLWPLLLVTVAAAVRSRRLGPRGHGPLTNADPSTQRRTFALLVAVMALVVAASFAWSVLYTDSNPAGAYFVTTTRLWELAVGGLLALLAGRIATMPRPVAVTLGWAGLAAIVSAALLYTGSTPFPGVAALAPVLGAAAVIAAGTAAGRNGPALLLDTAPMRRIGALSYSLYLWHWPLVTVAVAVAGYRSAVVGSIAVAASIVPAYVSHRFVENPVRRSPRFRGDPVRSLQLGGATTAVAVVAALAVIATMWPPPTASTPIPYAAQADGTTEVVRGAMVLADDPRDDPAGAPVDRVDAVTPRPEAARTDVGANFCSAALLEVEVRTCVGGDQFSTVDVALIGDSHAQQWTTPLLRVARDRKWKLTGYTKSGCPFLNQDVALGVDEQGRQASARNYTECAAWRDTVLARLLGPGATPPAMIIVSSTEHYAMDGDTVVTGRESTDLMVRGYQDVWRAFTERGTKVVVLLDTPAPGLPVPECVADHPDRLTACAFPRSEAVQTGDRTALAAAARATPSVTTVDLGDAVCPTERCAPVIGGVLVYRDISHMSATYAATLAPRLDRALPPLP